jgi:hypothetical protein
MRKQREDVRDHSPGRIVNKMPKMYGVQLYRMQVQEGEGERKLGERRLRGGVRVRTAGSAHSARVLLCNDSRKTLLSICHLGGLLSIEQQSIVIGRHAPQTRAPNYPTSIGQNWDFLRIQLMTSHGWVTVSYTSDYLQNLYKRSQLSRNRIDIHLLTTKGKDMFTSMQISQLMFVHI